MSKVEFDPKVIEAHASTLYNDAEKMRGQYVLVGAMVGLTVGLATFGFYHIGTTVAVVVLTAVGFVVGNDRAQQMTLEAQLALCQVRIEQNTRAWVDARRADRLEAAMTAPEEDGSDAETADEEPTMAGEVPVSSGNAPDDADRPSPLTPMSIAKPGATATWSSELDEDEDAPQSLSEAEMAALAQEEDSAEHPLTQPETESSDEEDEMADEWFDPDPAHTSMAFEASELAALVDKVGV